MATLPVRDGQIQPDVGQDVLKLAVVERHDKNGNLTVMTLSFISLPSIPEAGISDRGLIDVRNHALIPVVVQE